VAQILFTVLSVFIVDKAGRKLLMIIGCVGCGVTQLLFGIMYNSKDPDSMTPATQYLSLTWMVIFVCFFSISHGPVCWTYLAEIMHPMTMNFAVCVNLVFTIIITYVTEPAIRAIHSWLFYIYAIIMLASLIFVIFFMKETKGLTPEQVQQLFKRKAIAPKTEYTAEAEVTKPLKNDNEDKEL